MSETENGIAPGPEGPVPAGDTLSDQVEGERRIGSINRARSLQSRVSSVLSIGLLSALALGLLGWYYAHTYAAQAQAKQSAQAASKGKAQGDAALPPLGRIEPPAPGEHSALEEALGPAPEEPPEDIPEAWLKPAEDGPPTHAPVAAAVPAKTPEELALERKLSGPAFSRSAESLRAATLVTPESEAATGVTSEGSESAGQELSSLLKPTVMPAAQARVLPTQRLLLPKGAFIDCTLETAIDSTLPGMTTCVTATDTFGADGSTVLMERGTKLVGETRGQVQQGMARVFVLWNEARTPLGVVIPLASPGTDELGRSGLAGRVNRHFFERFGAAILISTIDGAVQGAVQSSGGTFIYNPSAAGDITTEVLKSTVSIPPTVTKANGDRIQVLVARDLDFRSVYELRPVRRER